MSAADTNNSHFKVPPHSTEAEMALLGSILLRPDGLDEVIDMINSESFYSEKHRLIFETILELSKKNSPIDMLSLSSRLKERGLLKKIGGNPYLTEVVNSVPSAAHLMHYGEIVQKKSIMRKLIRASENISQLGYNEMEDLDDLLDQAEKTIFEVTTGSQTQKLVEISGILGEAWERLDRLQKSDDSIRGVPTGFKDIDNKLSGLQRSDLIILAARPSMGKTALGLDIARQCAVYHNTPVGFFSLEMSSQQLVDRMLASHSRVDAWKLRTGKVSTDSDFNRIRDALDDLSKAPIYIDDTPANNILKIRSVARKMKSDKGLGMIIVDYLQLMMPTQTKASDSTVQQVTELSRSLKQLARELDVPVLALSQLSRAVEQRGGRPRLSDLRDSGSIEQDADVVMFIHREQTKEETGENYNLAELLIEKHRNGPTGKVNLYFDDEKSTFLTIEKSDFGQLEEEFSLPEETD
ncbi:MAG: replicative DNA helicase [Candidatus Paceibacterota bacterium]